MNSKRVYVGVMADFMPDGTMLPRSITWEDGIKYRVDRVCFVRPAHAQKSGGQGDRYTVMISGRQTYIFFERNADTDCANIGRWFVERRAE